MGTKALLFSLDNVILQIPNVGPYLLDAWLDQNGRSGPAVGLLLSSLLSRYRACPETSPFSEPSFGGKTSGIVDMTARVKIFINTR